MLVRPPRAQAATAQRPCLLEPVLASVDRAARLLRSQQGAGGSVEVDPALFQQQEEARLHEAVLTAEAMVSMRTKGSGR